MLGMMRDEFTRDTLCTVSSFLSAKCFMMKYLGLCILQQINIFVFLMLVIVSRVSYKSSIQCELQIDLFCSSCTLSAQTV